jgi:hypothetical protein
MAEGRLSNDALKQAAQERVASGEDIRERIRSLTLQALRERKFNFSQFQEVMRAMTAGISVGAQQRGEDVKSTLSEAFAGMDQALTKAAQAGTLAMRELASRSKQFGENDLKLALEQLQRLERDLVESVREVSQTSTGAVRAGWQDLFTHAQRAGTDTGAVIAATVRDFSGRMAGTVASTTTATLEAALQFGERFAQAASGFLAGMSDALRPDEKKEKDETKEQ